MFALVCSLSLLPLSPLLLSSAFQLANLLYTDRDLTQSELGQIVSSRRNDHKLQNLFMPKSQYSTAVSKWTEDVAVRINNKSVALAGRNTLTTH